MKKTLIGLVLAISMFTAQDIFAQCVMEDVFISHCAEEGIFINKGHKPNKAPANVPVKVRMSKEEHKVYICSSSDADIEYYMCDSNNTSLLSGNCDLLGVSVNKPSDQTEHKRSGSRKAIRVGA